MPVIEFWYLINFLTFTKLRTDLISQKYVDTFLSSYLIFPASPRPLTFHWSFIFTLQGGAERFTSWFLKIFRSRTKIFKWFLVHVFSSMYTSQQRHYEPIWPPLVFTPAPKPLPAEWHERRTVSSSKFDHAVSSASLAVWDDATSWTTTYPSRNDWVIQGRACYSSRWT